MPRGRFVNRPYEALLIKDYLPASSIATRAGAVIPSLGGVTMIFGIPMPCEKDK